MKLKQIHRHKTNSAGSGNDAFNTRLARQSASFGILVGAGQTQGINLECSDTESRPEGHDHWEYREPTLPSQMSSAVQVVAGAAKTIVAGLGEQVRRYSEASEEKAALRSLLARPDHFLRDIGLDRYQLEALQSSGGSLDDLVNPRKEAKVDRLRLVPNARIGDGPEHVFDRAA